jgi:hypothetical protein
MLMVTDMATGVVSYSEERLLGVGSSYLEGLSAAHLVSFLGGVTRALNISYLKAIPLGKSSNWLEVRLVLTVDRYNGPDSIQG